MKTGIDQLYFVEGNSVVIRDKHFTDQPIYNEYIYIESVDELLNPHNLKKIKEFKDWYSYATKNIEIHVILHSDGDYYDEERDLDFDTFIRILMHMNITVMNPLEKQDVLIIDTLMKKFNFNIYHCGTKRHSNNKEELIELLKDISLLA